MSKTGKKNIKKKNEAQLEQPEFENTGQYLYKLRTEKGLSTKEVSETTRISEVNLHAIEAQNFPSLPADTFTRGLLTIYADFLGVDPALIVSQFMQERDTGIASGKHSKVKQTKKILAPKTLAEPSHISSITMAGILLVLIITLFTGFCLYTSWNPFSFLTGETENFQSVMINVLPSRKTEEAQPGPAARSQTNNYTVCVTFLKDTGVDLTLDENETTELEFKKGDTYTWSAESALTLSFAQPESAMIRLNNTPVVFPEYKNGVATFSLPEALSKQQGDE